MADDTRAQAPARGWRLVVLAGFVGFTLTFAASHFLLPIRLWASVSETISLRRDCHFDRGRCGASTFPQPAPRKSTHERRDQQYVARSLHVRRQRAPGRLQSPLHANVQSLCRYRHTQEHAAQPPRIPDAKSSKNRSSFGIKAWNQRSIEDLVSDSRETIRSVRVAKSGSDRLRTPGTDHPVTNFNTMKNKSFMAGLLRRKICCNGSPGRIACRSECSKWRMLDAVGLLHHARSPDGPGLVPDAA